MNGEKPVEVILEGFGSKNLRRVFNKKDLPGNIDGVVRMMLSQNWEGVDTATLNSLNRKLSTTSGVYLPQVAKGGLFVGEPVKFDGISPYSPPGDFIQHTGADKPEDQLRIAITPAHKVAYM